MTPITYATVLIIFTSVVYLGKTRAVSLRPNIIFILADDLGWNDVGFHGSEIPTPNIDALAYNGVILNKFYTAPSCTPSRAALLTGFYPSRLGISGSPPIIAGQPKGLDLSKKLLPQYLKELGYSTHIIGKWHLGFFNRSYLPTERGFDSHFGYWNGYIGHYDGIHKTTKGMEGKDFHRGETGAWEEADGRYITDVLSDEALRIIHNHSSSKPLFMLLSHSAPHTGNPGPHLFQEPPHPLDPLKYPIKDEKRRVTAGVIKAMDDSVGKILRALNDEGMLEETVVVFQSDNGGHTNDTIHHMGNAGSNYPLRGEKNSPHDGGTRVPTLAWSPLFNKPGRVYNHLMHMVDWLPTLISLAGGSESTINDVDGMNLWESIRTGNAESNPTRSEMLITMSGEVEAYLKQNWKLVKNFRSSNLYSLADVFMGHYENLDYNINEVRWSDAGILSHQLIKQSNRTDWKTTYANLREEATVTCPTREEGSVVKCNPNHCLFDLELDPCETTDLAPTHPEKVQQLRAIISSHLLRPNPSQPVDPASNPACFRTGKLKNYWTPWLDNLYLKQNTCIG